MGRAGTLRRWIPGETDGGSLPSWQNNVKRIDRTLHSGLALGAVPLDGGSPRYGFLSKHGFKSKRAA